MAIKKTVNSIQHLRNSAITATSKEQAISALNNVKNARDGEIVLNRYFTDSTSANVKTIFAINYVGGDDSTATGKSLTIFDFDKDALDALDARVVALSGTNESTSADTSVAGAKKYTDDKIGTLDYTDTPSEGSYVSAVSESDGIISVSRGELPTVAAISGEGQAITAVSQTLGAVDAEYGDIAAAHVSVADEGELFSATTVENVLAEIVGKIEHATITAADKSINVATSATGTTVAVNIKSGADNQLKLDADNGLYTNLYLSSVTPSSTTVKEEYGLFNDGAQVASGNTIKIYKDSSLVSITYITDPADAHYQNLEYVYIDASGNTKTEYVDISSLVLEAEFASGVGITNHVAHGVVDPTSETFLTVGANGFKLSGVQDAIDTAISGLDVTADTAVAGQYVAAIEETDGIVAVKDRANVSEAVLNNYSKGSDSGAVASTDTINQAVSKLENQIDAVTSVVEDLDATITSDTGYYISKVDQVNGKISGETTALPSVGAIFVSGKPITAVAESLGEISASAGTIEAQYVTVADTGEVFSSTTVEDVLAEISAVIEENERVTSAAFNAVSGEMSSITSTLTAEIAARKAVDGVNGDAYSPDTTAHYISGASSLYGADQALDAALYEVSGKVNSNEVVSGNGTSVTATQSGKTQVAVRHGSVDGVLEDALTFNNNGDLAFSGVLDAGTY